jgi:integrase
LTVHVAHECRERTAEQYRSTFKHHVYPALGELLLGELRRSHIRALLASKVGLSRSTLKNVLVPLRAMLNAAVDEERIPGNPAIRVLKRKRGQTEDDARRMTTLTEEELSRILRAADERCPEHADAVYLLAWTGLRISEACGLQWGDLDLGGHFLSAASPHRGCSLPQATIPSR